MEALGFGGCRCGCDGGLLEWCAVCVVSEGGRERGLLSIFQGLGRCGTRECLFWFCRFGIRSRLSRGGDEGLVVDLDITKAGSLTRKLSKI